MTQTRRRTSPVLMDQVAGDALGRIMRAGGPRPLPEVRPSLKQVALDRIVAGSDFQTRAPLNPEGDPQDAELVESVRQVGVRQPVHLLDQGDGTYCIRSGHRRVSAARLADLAKVPAIVWPHNTEAFDSALDTWLENLHRKDLSPLERGRMLALMLERFGLPRSGDTARRLGLSKTSFYRYLGLLKSSADVQEALGEGTIGVAQAEKIAAVEDPGLRSRLIEAANKGVPAGQIGEALKRHRSGEPFPDGLLDAGSPPGRDGRADVGRKETQAWAQRKVRELTRTLGLRAFELEPVTKALKARRISGAHATAAALLIAGGDRSVDALEAVAALDRNVLGAVETIFKAVRASGKGYCDPAGRSTLRRILGLLVMRLEDEVVADARA